MAIEKPELEREEHERERCGPHDEPSTHGGDRKRDDRQRDGPSAPRAQEEQDRNGAGAETADNLQAQEPNPRRDLVEEDVAQHVGVLHGAMGEREVVHTRQRVGGGYDATDREMPGEVEVAEKSHRERAHRHEEAQQPERQWSPRQRSRPFGGSAVSSHTAAHPRWLVLDRRERAHLVSSRRTPGPSRGRRESCLGRLV